MTVNVYGVPLVRPVIEQLLAPEVLHVRPPGDAVTVNPAIALAPTKPGATHETKAAPFDGVAVTRSGAPGVPGMTADEAPDEGPVPAAFAARTVNVYGLPLSSPVTLQEVARVVHVAPPGLDVTT